MGVMTAEDRRGSKDVSIVGENEAENDSNTPDIDLEAGRHCDISVSSKHFRPVRATNGLEGFGVKANKDFPITISDYPTMTDVVGASLKETALQKEKL